MEVGGGCGMSETPSGRSPPWKRARCSLCEEVLDQSSEIGSPVLKCAKCDDGGALPDVVGFPFVPGSGRGSAGSSGVGVPPLALVLRGYAGGSSLQLPDEGALRGGLSSEAVGGGVSGLEQPVDGDKCLARVFVRGVGKQCSSRLRAGSVFCGTHRMVRPHGRIDGKIPDATVEAFGKAQNGLVGVDGGAGVVRRAVRRRRGGAAGRGR